MSKAIPGTANGSADNPSGSAPERLLAQLRSNPLVPLLIAGAAAIAVIAALLLWAQAPDYRVLYSNFSEADGGRIIAELDKRAVPYRLSDGGTALLVPAEQMHSLRLQLAEQGLPQAGNVGFELMDKQAFGVSQFAEHLNFQRGLEGELARSIESLGPVAKARVHLAMAKQSIFVRDRQPASASVVLTLHPGRSLGEGQVDAIVHMVGSSVPELAAEAVTVVDQSGRLLSMPGNSGRDLDGTQLSYVDEVESSYQRRIERILSPILGAQNVRAQVAAEIDFATREQTAERYAPNQTAGDAAIRSQQLSENYTGGDELARGVPGALSNTPPAPPAPPAPAARPGKAADAKGAAAQTAEPAPAAEADPRNSLRRDNVVNYEVDRSVEHVQQRRGTIKRLTAAVVVNFRGGVDADGKPTREALSAEELTQINRLVRQAIGFSAERGDALEVVNSPFTEAQEVVLESVWWQTPEFFVMATSIARYLLVALAALLLWLLLLRPLLRRHAPAVVAAAATEAVEGAGATATTSEAPTAASEEASIAATGELQRRLRRRSAVYEHNLAHLREMAQEDPRLIAMIVSGWMKKND
ncbi:flagellar M-ring protein FliF [Pseudomonas linyingensis]|uniref:Flagellar M-ring protein n=1 Tax=Pseudomonas linyingensis TaxID=915471 RepID=A0A1H6YFM6_9PSED|nr:flagellar basal-body MS-ring/collar protein FliF [Pseudomonas linyingensis]SEJ40088.1 flagellar M-ring protein FliF [Pseudomonas linyingensis]